jgi:cell division protein FtsQ
VRRTAAVGVTLGVLAAAIVLLWTPVVAVRSVSVTGTLRVSAHAVRQAANIQRGHPMLTLPLGEITRRVSALPAVDSVHVARRWPSSVRIQVTERTPVAWRAEPDGAHLLDGSGADFAVVSQAPKGLPRLTVSSGSARKARVRAALHALATLPPRLDERIVTVSADSPADVRFTLARGNTVVWGAPENARRKAAVLAVLLTRSGSTYNVAAPDLPTVS